MKLTEHLELSLRNGHGVMFDHGDVEQLVGKLRAAEELAAVTQKLIDEQYAEAGHARAIQVLALMEYNNAGKGEV